MDGRSVVVERAGPADESRITALLDDAATWLQAHGIEQWTPGSFAREVAAATAGGEMYVARTSEAIVGCFRLSRQDPGDASSAWPAHGTDDAGTTCCYLSRLAIARDASGSSLGTHLLEEAERIAVSAGLDFVRLDCWAGNQRLRRYYTDAGFEHVGDVQTSIRDRNGEVGQISLFERRVRSHRR